MNGNDFMSWVLRSPFHGMLSNGTMLITVTGRKTGRQITTPVDYYEDSGYLWILTSRERTWWRNLRGGANVKLLLKRKPVNGIAETEFDGKAVEVHIYDYIKHIPKAAKPMGIHMENKIPNAEDVARIAKDRLFVRIRVD